MILPLVSLEEERNFGEAVSIGELWELVTLDCNFNLLMPNQKIILIKFYGNWVIEGSQNKLGWERRSGGKGIGHGWEL